MKALSNENGLRLPKEGLGNSQCYNLLVTITHIYEGVCGVIGGICIVLCSKAANL